MRLIDADALKTAFRDPYLCNVTPRHLEIIDAAPHHRRCGGGGEVRRMADLIERLRKEAEWVGQLDYMPCDTRDILMDAAAELDKRRWMPVEERLPEVGKKTLLFWWANSEPVIDTGFRLANGWSATHWELGQVSVTHWMPLPEPPEEVQDG